MSNLYTAHCKILNNIKEDPNKLGDIACSWTGTFENDNTSKKCLQIQCFDSKIDMEIAKSVGKHTFSSHNWLQS